MNSPRTIVGILVGGGPAPGINSVISAVTIRSILGLLIPVKCQISSTAVPGFPAASAWLESLREKLSLRLRLHFTGKMFQ